MILGSSFAIAAIVVVLHALPIQSSPIDGNHNDQSTCDLVSVNGTRFYPDPSALDLMEHRMLMTGVKCTGQQSCGRDNILTLCYGGVFRYYKCAANEICPIHQVAYPVCVAR